MNYHYYILDYSNPFKYFATLICQCPLGLEKNKLFKQSLKIFNKKIELLSEGDIECYYFDLKKHLKYYKNKSIGGIL